MLASKTSRFVTEAQRSIGAVAASHRGGHHQSATCLALTGRLRALREAGFRVTLVSAPANC